MSLSDIAEFEEPDMPDDDVSALFEESPEYKYWLVGFDKKKNIPQMNIKKYIKRILAKDIDYYYDFHYTKKPLLNKEEFHISSSTVFDLAIIIRKQDRSHLEKLLRANKARNKLRIIYLPFISSVNYFKK